MSATIGFPGEDRVVIDDLDQTHLPELIDELRELERDYPVIGTP
ncbi:MAG: hypothetical protein JWQ81_5202 [Amycolatopsis sp.]|jgi:hypothetical protein|nr:hypothetical protein [Amycolatopsis sp.]MCU1684463.1 hypothetical protein [Amycolatopsis sp.]